MGALRESENRLIKAKTQHVQRDGHRRMSKILKNGYLIVHHASHARFHTKIFRKSQSFEPKSCLAELSDAKRRIKLPNMDAINPATKGSGGRGMSHPKPPYEMNEILQYSRMVPVPVT
jgi:hypothetical protein